MNILRLHLVYRLGMCTKNTERYQLCRLSKLPLLSQLPLFMYDVKGVWCCFQRDCRTKCVMNA